MIYNTDGEIKVTVVDGSTRTGIQATDGSIYAVLNDGTSVLGKYHPCGAFNAISTAIPNYTQAPNGSIYVTYSNGNYIISNPSKVTTPVKSTNLVANSGKFDLWTPTVSTISPDVVAEPVNGTITADRFTEINGLGQHGITASNISFTSGTSYTFSMYVKYETTPFIQLLFSGTAFGQDAWANFNIQTGVKGTVAASATAGIIPAGNGWYRIYVTATATATASAPIVIFGANSATMTRALSYTGSDVNTRLFANAQVEVGTTPGVYSST